MRILCLLAPAVAALALAACGGEDPAPASSSSNRPALDQKTKQAMLDFARCMRQHGVDAPDPKFDGGGARMQVNSGRDQPPEELKAAEQACAKYQKQIKPPAVPKEEQAELKQQALANARCMREHGIDMPDPQFGPNGEIQQRIGGKIKPTDQKFQAAMKACNKGGGLFGGQAAP
jgi:hypothetical protein